MTSGGLAVFCPVPLTAEVRSTIQRLGNDVRYIAAQNIEHHMSLGEWHQAYPQAKVIGPEGLAEKRASQKKEHVPFSTIFTQTNKHALRVGDDFDRDFDYEYVGSHVNREIVVHYRPDRTLIQADLIFNLPAIEQYSRVNNNKTSSSSVLTSAWNVFSRCWSSLRQGGVGGSGGGGGSSSILSATNPSTTIWQQRLLWYAFSARDRPGFQTSMQRIRRWDFQRIIPCHGELILSDAKSVFDHLMAWHLESGGTGSKVL